MTDPTQWSGDSLTKLARLIKDLDMLLLNAPGGRAAKFSA